jgi:hypothetical protein
VPDLGFRIESAAVVPYAATPSLAFSLRVTNRPPTEVIHTVVLRCQVQLDVARRPYSESEQDRLRDLFGAPDRWRTSVRSMLWTHVSAIVPGFAGDRSVELVVPCTFDFNVAATKYFHGLDDGEVPMTFLFSGSVFYENEVRTLQVTPIPWDRECTFRMPVTAWKTVIDHYYPNVAWLALEREAFDRLYQYKQDRGLATWEQAVLEATRA